MSAKPIFPITTIAELLEVHQRTLRIYDKMNILTPKRTLKNRRMYSQDDIEKAKLIQYLTRNLAINLSGVKIILGLLEKLKINPDKRFELINKIALDKEINEISNLEKTSKRGRKSKTKNNV